MKKASEKDEMLPEYNFTKGVRGKYAKRYAEGTNIVMIDPVNWEGEWKTVKHYRRAEDRDIVEVHCPPDLDDHIAGTHTGENGR